MENDKKQTGVEQPEPQTTKLVDLIDYQKGSVVSREIIKKRMGTVTLFAFDEG